MTVRAIHCVTQLGKSNVTCMRPIFKRMNSVIIANAAAILVFIAREGLKEDLHPAFNLKLPIK